MTIFNRKLLIAATVLALSSTAAQAQGLQFLNNLSGPLSLGGGSLTTGALGNTSLGLDNLGQGSLNGLLGGNTRTSTLGLQALSNIGNGSLNVSAGNGNVIGRGNGLGLGAN